MLAIVAVASHRTAASSRRCTGTREISSTVIRSASGDQAAMIWDTMVPSAACRTLPATLAATPRARAPRTAHRTRCRRAGGMMVMGRTSGVRSRARPELRSPGRARPVGSDHDRGPVLAEHVYQHTPRLRAVVGVVAGSHRPPAHPAPAGPQRTLKHL